MKLQQILIIFTIFHILLLLIFFSLIHLLVLKSQLSFKLLYSFILVFYYFIFLFNFIVPTFNLLFEEIKMITDISVLSLFLLLLISLCNKTFIKCMLCHCSTVDTKWILWLVRHLIISWMSTRFWIYQLSTVFGMKWKSSSLQSVLKSFWMNLCLEIWWFWRRRRSEMRIRIWNNEGLVYILDRWSYRCWGLKRLLEYRILILGICFIAFRQLTYRSIYFLFAHST